MKQTIKLILTLALVTLFHLQTNAQYSDTPLSLNIRAGANLSKINGKDIGFDPRIGFRLDTRVTYTFGSDVYLQSGLSFLHKSTKSTSEGEGDINGDSYKDYTYITENVSMNYLQVPIIVGYRLAVSDKSDIYIGGGAYIAYGIGGKYKYTANGSNIAEHQEAFRFENKYKTFEEAGPLKKIDAGLVLDMGIDYNRLTVNIGIEHGLMKVGRRGLSENKLKQQNVFAAIGFRIF